MADVHKGHEEKGIKLFGATIAVQVRREKESEPSKTDPQTLTDKRPDKIIACPRCQSIDTKFCYFNNYNVNQPRHFCKGCQRYWTAGGALRNVPVGAGRRKAKPPINGGVQQLDFDGAVEEWQLAEQGGFHHVLPAKRRRGISGNQSC